MKQDEAGKVITLEGCRNFRDLGGYGGPSGITRYGKFYRSDALSRLAAGDIGELEERRVNCIIDLRYATEISRAPSAFADHAGVSYHNIPLTDGFNSEAGGIPVIESLPRLYKSLLDTAGRELVRVFRILSRQEEGAAVFHCTAGKDRTGITAALLLNLCDIDDRTIICDYALSHENMKPIFEAVGREAAAAGIPISPQLFLSEPEFMKEFLDYLRNKFKGAGQYLLEQGLENDEIGALRRLFLEK